MKQKRALFLILLFTSVFFFAGKNFGDITMPKTSTDEIPVSDSMTVQTSSVSVSTISDATVKSDSIVEIPALQSPSQMQIPQKTASEIAGDELLNTIEFSEIKNSSAAAVIVSSNASVLASSDTASVSVSTISLAQSASVKPQETQKQEDKDFLKTVLPDTFMPKLPFESQLLLSGRKLIGFNYSGKLYDKEESGKRTNSSSFSMDQELQMKIKGKVGDRLELNVDFDDTQEDKKDISIVYKGHGDEFVQQAAFGDINVVLPSTEFSGYSKELFGVKVDTKYKALKTNMFFSKTKGYSESKQFKGNTKTEKKIIPDTAYIQLKYYSIIKDPSKTIRPDSAKVYLDKSKVTPTDYIVISTSTDLYYMKNPAEPAYNGNFIKLVAGTDYTIDYNTGVMSFKSTLSKQYVVAIDYQYSDGTWLSDSTSGNPQIIKDVNNTSALSTELHTFYSLGNYQIAKYNGRDNFILEVRDLNNSFPTIIDPGNKPVPKYPNIEGYPANITVDFDNGIFNLQPIDGTPMHDDLYTTAMHRYNFVTEYQYKVKIFNLTADIVPMSEKVVIDGVALKINQDYILDYDAGILTILNDNLIKETSVIDISYDYSPLGGSAAGSTLVGLRSQYDFNSNLSLGGSFIYEFSAQEETLPDLYNTPSSTLVGEVDAKIKDVKITDGLTMSAGAEYAMSKYMENTAGKAIIESMEGAKQEDGISMIDDAWFYSSSRDNSGAYSFYEYNTADLSWRNYEIKKKEINPNLEIVSDETQQVMDLNYDCSASEYVSIGQVMSQSGYDFTDKLYIEIWVKGNFNNVTMRLDYASSINEDSDKNLALGTEDTNGDGIISPWEDIGRDFVNKNSAYGISKIGARNGLLDTEDLNGNNILDRSETNLNSFIINDYANLAVTSWQKIQIPLNITTDSDREKWKNIKIARITLSGSTSGIVTVGKISLIGNKWKEIVSNSLSGFEISSIGRDDPSYVSLLTNPSYRSLYDIDSTVARDEQSLAMEYDSNAANDEFYAKATYSTGFDISSYEKFKFFLYIASTTATAGNESTFIMRAGGDNSNYYQYSIPITDDMKGKWNLISIRQTGYGVNAKWASDGSAASIDIVGSPSLQKIAFIQTGIKTQGPDTGEIWVNEIHVSDSKSKDGNAWKVNMNLKWDGTDALGAVSVDINRKSIDKNFETFAPGTYGRDYLQDTAAVSFKGVNVDGIAVLPLNLSLVKTKTDTPLALQNQSDVVSVLDEGRVVSYTGKAQTVLSAGTELPKVTLEYNRFLKDTEKIEQLEDMESISANLFYLNPVDFEIMPTSLTADYKISNSYYKVYPEEPINDTNAFLDLQTAKKYMDVDDFLTLEKTETWGLKTPFKFFDKVVFSPGYVLTKVNEKNKKYFEGEEIDYDKLLNQDIGASLNFQIAKWLQPGITYNINTKETYDLNYSTAAANIIYPGQTKYIERVGTAEMTWNLQAKDISASKYLKSLSFTTSYRLQDSDAYSNVEKDFSSIGFAVDKLWIRGNHLKEIQLSTGSYIVKSIVQRDDRRVIGRYNPFETFNFTDALLPIKTMTMSFTFTEGSEDSYITGTRRNSYTRTWPDILIAMTRFEKLLNADWMSDTQLNLKHNKKTNTVAAVSYADSIMFGGDYRFKLFKKFDISFGSDITSTKEIDTVKNVMMQEGETFNWTLHTATDIKQWRMSLKYANSQNWAKNSTGKLSSQTFTNSINGQVTSDLLFPAGIKLPIFGVIPLKNRLMIDSNVFYAAQSSAVNVEDNNLQNYGLKFSGDYEISKNFRCTLGAGWSRYIYTYVPDENYTLVELAAKLTIQF